MTVPAVENLFPIIITRFGKQAVLMSNYYLALICVLERPLAEIVVREFA